MDYLKAYRSVLETTFPSLTIFSDLNWEEITGEYLVSYEERPELDDFAQNFPSYLQSKADDGDCPPYLFELAYFELAERSLEDFPKEEFPTSPGVYLNPSSLFLELEYDVVRMLKNSSPGKPQVFEKSHVLCIYLDLTFSVSLMEINKDSLEILEQLEDGPKPDDSFISESQRALFSSLTDSEIVLHLV